MPPPRRIAPPWGGGRSHWEDLLASEGAEALSDEVELIGRLLALLDPLLVRAMMDDEADVALRARAESTTGEARMVTSLAGSIAHGLVGASSLAGRVGAGLKGTFGGLVPVPRVSHAVANAGTAPTPPPTLSSAAIATAVDAAGVAAAAAAAAASATAMAATDTEDDSSSLFAAVLQQLLLLLHLPNLEGVTLSPAAAAACGSASQRVRELLWRDLEQGNVWAQLACNGSVRDSPNARESGDAVWAARRRHVLNLLTCLGIPLRDGALDRSGARPAATGLAEALVPTLQVRGARSGIGRGCGSGVLVSPFRAREQPAPSDDAHPSSDPLLLRRALCAHTATSSVSSLHLPPVRPPAAAPHPRSRRPSLT